MERCRLETRGPHCWERRPPHIPHLPWHRQRERLWLPCRGWGVVSPCLDHRSFTSKN